MLSIKREEKTIDGTRFVCQQFPAMRAFGLLARLVKAVGPALGALVKLDPSTELSLLGEEVAGAFAALDAREATALVPEILNGTTAVVSGTNGVPFEIPLLRPEAIDQVFSGRLGVMFQVLGFALQVNYRDFSQGSAPAAPNAPVLPAG